jgi:hypothetical protein
MNGELTFGTDSRQESSAHWDGKETKEPGTDSVAALGWAQAFIDWVYLPRGSWVKGKKMWKAWEELNRETVPLW